ncbi:hypothetical protein MRX96_042927 [Rhipicephalus microplus]
MLTMHDEFHPSDDWCSDVGDEARARAIDRSSCPTDLDDERIICGLDQSVVVIDDPEIISEPAEVQPIVALIHEAHDLCLAACFNRHTSLEKKIDCSSNVGATSKGHC